MVDQRSGSVPHGRRNPRVTSGGAVTVTGTLRAGRARLVSTGTETPGLDAEVLLRHVLEVDRAALFARLGDAVDEESLARYRDLLEQRAAGAPVAYLVGEREFMGLPFAVGHGSAIRGWARGSRAETGN
jgi:methylase of polypeptide subunit release factors